MKIDGIYYAEIESFGLYIPVQFIIEDNRFCINDGNIEHDLTLKYHVIGNCNVSEENKNDNTR